MKLIYSRLARLASVIHRELLQECLKSRCLNKHFRTYDSSMMPPKRCGRDLVPELSGNYSEAAQCVGECGNCVTGLGIDIRSS